MATDEDYKLLGLEGVISLDKTKRAFRLRAQELHPDKKGGDAAAFIRLKKAYAVVLEDVKSGNARVLRRSSLQSTHGQYDAFTDPDYDKRQFFEPDNPATEGFERGMRAKGCSICHGLGKITKNVHPEKGFLGRETRHCRCQWV